MNQKNSRRSVLKSISAGASLLAINPMSMNIDDLEAKPKLKGNINHSVCKWCYGKIPLEQFCIEVKKMGIKAIDILGPNDWPILKKHGLECSLATTGAINIPEGFNHIKNHADLYKTYSEMIPLVAAAGYDKIICFSGNRKGISDAEGLENCVQGLKPLLPIAEKNKVTIVMELLNSKVNHKDYQCDHTKWGVELCKMLGSDRFKLLYDIYHMQIMEGDVIATINEYHPYFAHYHTGGVPGRAEIDTTQELYYPAIMQAIIKTGYKGYVAQEFVPKRTDVLASLAQSIKICDV